MALTSSIQVKVSATLQSILDLVTPSAPLSYNKQYQLTDGTGAGNANNIFSDTRTLAASASEDLDLSGVLTNALGSALSFTKIKALIITAAAANTNDVVVGGAAGAPITSLFGASTDKVNIKPGGTVAFIAPDANGYAVTATTADLLKIANSAGTTSVTYDIIVIGVA